MSQGDEDTEKEHEPTQKKLDDARRKGDFPKSSDLNTAAAYGGLLLAILIVGPSSLSDIGQALANLVGKSDSLSEIWFQNSGTAISLSVMSDALRPLAGWFGIPAIAVILTIIAQRAFVVAPDKLVPKLSRISPISNAKNKFGRSGLFEFFKSFLKLLIYSFILGYFLYWQKDEIVSAMRLDIGSVLNALMELTVEFLAIVLLIAISIGFLDLIFQHQDHQRKNRMSRKELTDETKQSEGDPHMKQQRRQRAFEIAMNQMLAEVPEADVVIVNPTHYAVALKWDRASAAAPKCVAKGVDEIAARIRELAAEHAIPIHRDAATARALFSSVDIGKEILPTHYKAVAAAIRFAEMMRMKAKGRHA